MSVQVDSAGSRAIQQELANLRSEVTRLQVELASERSARLRAEKVAAAKDEFIAVVSHELRAPLGAILGWAHMLHRPANHEEYQRGLEVIEQSVQSQSRLIDDLLDMNRMASGRIRLEIELLDLAGLVDAAVESVRPDAEARDIELRLALAAPGSMVRGDPTRLRQVLWNLLSNAVKFTPAGGAVDVVLRQSGDDAVLTVTDTGCGIPAEFLPHVFERFRQAPSTSQGYGGLGLGLAIARHLMDLHGGRIEAHSEGEGRGATFTVRLPLAR